MSATEIKTIEYTVKVQDMDAEYEVFEEQLTTTDRSTALTWFKLWKAQYRSVNGYGNFKVTMTEKNVDIFSPGGIYI